MSKEVWIGLSRKFRNSAIVIFLIGIMAAYKFSYWDFIKVGEIQFDTWVLFSVWIGLSLVCIVTSLFFSFLGKINKQVEKDFTGLD
jgi:hypothetical protein